MAILCFPLSFNAIKPQDTRLLHLSLRWSNPKHIRLLYRRRLAVASRRNGFPSASTSLELHRTLHGPETGGQTSVPTFQEAIQRLQEYWASVGCSVMQCSNTEVGAGTMNPLTFLRVLGPEPWNVVYVEPSVRPDDSRYGENPNRLQRHTQFQVILKPDPGNAQDLFIDSLSALGINVKSHDIRFVEDNWESPVLGAWGLGWEIWMDGMEITQFTYFQQAGSLQVKPVSVEITYGLERILMLLQEVDHFKNIRYTDEISYGELFLENEKEMSAYYLEHANVENVLKQFESYDEDARSLLSIGLPIPAYDQLLKASHAFNILDSRGFIGVTERARYFSRMRSLARECAQLWVKSREMLGFPLGISSEENSAIFSKILVTEQAKQVLQVPSAFVLEIGTEEMPPHDVVDAIEQLKSFILLTLEKRRLGHGEVVAHGTPRRLVICIENLSLRQGDNEVEIRGPPATRAFDHDGKHTKAAEGFCRKYSLPIDHLYKRVDGKTEYAYVRVREYARSALEVLAEDLPNVLSRITFSKSMRWNSQVMFSRPVRWILALHGDLVIPFNFAGVSSGKQSYGLRNSHSVLLEVETAESYLPTIMKAGILIDMKVRKDRILHESILLAASVGGKLAIEDSLVEEVINLVEAPNPILGSYDESFLELPKDILITVMQKYQKYFPVTDESSNRLLPFFIVVANGMLNKSVVQKGNEAVLRARFEDANFFYKMDTQKKLSEYRGYLNGILFHEKLGTMLDKIARVQNIVVKLALALGLGEDVFPIVENAAALAMSDLATSVVTEFTSLSGVMARHYALKDGYSKEIAEALFEITLPRFSGDLLPKTDAGIVLAIADRLDSLVGLFGAGCQPTSTADPFGLRRICYGLVQILVENKRNLDLSNSLRLVANVQPIDIDDNQIQDVWQFVTRRLEQLLLDKGIRSEIVHSILSERANWPFMAAQSAIDMEEFSKSDLFHEVIEVYSRPTRIIRGKSFDADLEVTETAFEHNEEQVLWDAYLGVAKKIHAGVDINTFLTTSLQLIRPLEDFFKSVYVMTDDQRVRNNRLALLKRIADLPKGIADLSVLPGF
ncbi:glycine--tRNA ligase, chloroplastic/mitochondrial 2 [Phalaenopsis equestris]|uniref:glycine--tRNA ligase, chloroplastic/mitochondrial 2 n=1 Tax=Phalaenopsis equestris TaxID=78828 RepID=UPI0009E415A4|nr:glycine--tRNA ligase, chloroplastic/mitochondrial 2 [Phalaenopsis equestris]